MAKRPSNVLSPNGAEHFVRQHGGIVHHNEGGNSLPDPLTPTKVRKRKHGPRTAVGTPTLKQLEKRAKVKSGKQ